MPPPPSILASANFDFAPGEAPDIRARFLRDVLQGLARPRKAIPSLWFYDAQGSRIFQRIMALDAYYPTRIEHEILTSHAIEITAPLGGGPCTVVDLGAGDGTKTRLLLAPLHRRCTRAAYAPIDISAAALADVAARMSSTFPRLRITPVQAEYFDGLRALHDRDAGTLLVLFLGSNIGNLEAPEAIAFLRTMRTALRPGDHVLVGFDLLKDLSVLRAAYDDDAGVTAAFNLNLLARINRELDGDFDLESFEHVASFDPQRPAMESWLRSRRRQRVRVAGQSFTFEAGESIHTEISCKYREADVTALAAAAGFLEVGRFRDRRNWFADALWRVGET
jgi:dimethylhistidine N-methyltransferase